jgi:diguanylate cyclase (GGDEF)-like protein/PAS domain S-box-containing protein
MEADQTRVIFDTLDRLSGVHTTQGIVHLLKNAAGKLAAADGAVVMLRDGDEIRSVDKDARWPLCEGQRFPLNSCVSGWVIRNRQCAVIEDGFSDPRVSVTILARASARSLAVFPIRSADPIGVLGVYWKEQRVADPGLAIALQTLANAAAIAIENARLLSSVEVAYRSARQEAQKYSHLVDAVNGVVWEANLRTFCFTFVSEQAERLLGYPLSAWTANENFWLDHVHPDDREWSPTFGRRSPGTGDPGHFEYRMIAADGRTVWIADYVSIARRDDNTECLRGVMVDITEQKALESQLTWHARYDSLTSLPNRAHFLDQAEKEVRGTAGRARTPLAILLVDLDRFQHINDSFGHLAGDALLMAVAARLRKLFPESETVARMASDEFAILAPGAGHPDKARAIADRIHAVFSRPFNIAGTSVYVTASVGIALATGTRRSARDLLREADTAMYRAKKAGRARSEFFDASMQQDVVCRLRLESDLRRAVTRREFELHYQPIVDINTRRVLGFEALLRWPHPKRGVLLPAEFLIVAEDTGLMVELGYDALVRAGATLSRWAQRSSPRPWVSVNFSPVQLADPDLLRRVRSVLATSSIPPESLKLEITEAGIEQSEAVVRERLRQLHDMGVGIFIDDFGAGTSSFSRLLDAPVDTIKIDQRFIGEVSTPDCDAPLLRSIIALGRNLKVGLIAEGVESETQMLGLRELGCKFAQGFYFGRPEPLDRAEMLMER